MRFLYLVFFLFLIFESFSQTGGKVILSGIVVGPDSIPVPDVAIINTRTNQSVRTNATGLFQVEIATEDSLMTYHIAFKRRFISEKNNGRYIVLDPEVRELMQVDVTNKTQQDLKNLEETVDDIKRLAPLKKITEYDEKSRQTRFVKENGSHDKGFSPFFGPTIKSPLAKVIDLVAGNTEKKQRKKLTSHYHLVKTKKQTK